MMTMPRFLSLAIFVVLATGLVACATTGRAPTAQAVDDSGNASGPGVVELPFEARGNEPGWLLVIDDQMTLDWAYGTRRAQVPRPEPMRAADAITYAVAGDAHTLNVHITERLCHDSMIGMPYPYTVSVTIDGSRLAGCGGAPESLLVGVTWVVEDIAERGIIDASHMTLAFDDNGHVSGHAGCNQYRASYDVTGEGLRIGPIASTRQACAPALNNQESRFLDVLQNARHFDIDPTGKLIIHTGSGQTIEAYPAG